MSIYGVTFLTFDHFVGGNPFWHSAFCLSKLNEETNQFEVVDTWGYYGVPSTGDKTSWFVKAKKAMGLDIDLNGNHGWLIHEEMRYMELGYGLHGHTFELTEEQFNRLQEECTKRVAAQEAAVSEELKHLGVMPTEGAKIRHYLGEEFSAHIFATEKLRARLRGIESRLKPFELNLTLSPWGVSLATSHTCKTEALNILGTVLPTEKLLPYKASPFPRFVSGGLEPIILHSVGAVSEHTKASGEKVYYRKRETGAKLVWTFPPQKFDELAESRAKEFLAIDEEYRDEVRSVIGKLQRLEWLIRNAVIPKQYTSYRDDLIKRIVEHYRVFSVMKPELKTHPKVSGWIGSTLSLFGIPKNPEQEYLIRHIKSAKYLFNSLYMAIIDGWRIDDSLLSETAFEEERASAAMGGADESNEEEDVYYNSLEALASYLPIKDQMKLCQIIGRTYLKSDPLEHETRAPSITG